MDLRLQDIGKKSAPSEKPNMGYQIQMTRVREGAPERYRADIYLNISWFELKSHVTSGFGLCGCLWPVPKKNQAVTKLCAETLPIMDLLRAMIPNSFQLSCSLTFACATEIQFSFVT